jgi:hypothetical protein
MENHGKMMKTISEDEGILYKEGSLLLSKTNDNSAFIHEDGSCPTGPS